jgi:adenylate kinase
VNNKKKVIILLGPPGVGKGTVAQLLQENNTNFKHVSLGSICREYALEDTDLGCLIKNTIDNGNLVTLELIKIIIDKVFTDFFHNDNFSKFDTIVLDGFPRTLPQAELFSTLMNEYIDLIDFKIILFHLDSEKLKQRLVDRYICSNVKCDKIYALSNLLNKNLLCIKCNDHLYKRKDDSLEIILSRLDIYEKEESLIINYFNKYNILFVKIDADNTINNIVDLVYQNLYVNHETNIPVFSNR